MAGKKTELEKLTLWVEEKLADEVSIYAPNRWAGQLIDEARDHGCEIVRGDKDSLEDLREAIERLGWNPPEE